MNKRTVSLIASVFLAMVLNVGAFGQMGQTTIIHGGTSLPISCQGFDLFMYSNGGVSALYSNTNPSVGACSWVSSSSASVASIGGTANEIASTGGTNPVLSITNPFVFPGMATFAASTTSAASLIIPSGSAPATPASGAEWNLSGVRQFYDGSHTNSYVRIQNPVVSGNCPQFSGVTGLLSDSGSPCQGNLFTSFQFASYTAMTGAGVYFRLVPGTGITSSYSGSGTSASPYIGTLSLANPTATTLGGIESLTAVSHKWINAISTSGVPSAAQPVCADLSDSVSTCNTLPTLPQTLANASHKWINSYNSTTGVFTQTQPADTDLTGTTTNDVLCVASGFVAECAAPTVAVTNMTGTGGFSTTGSAASFTGSLAGDVGGTQGATVLATVNSNVGSFANANITVNAKGLITAASNGSGGGTYTLQVGGSSLSSGDTVNFNNTTPAAGSNGLNIQFQTSKSATTDSVSGEIVGDGTVTHFLNGTGGWSAPAGSGTVTSSGSPVSGNISKFTTATNIAPAAYSDVVGLWAGGSCSGYLKNDGTCGAGGGSGTVTQIVFSSPLTGGTVTTTGTVGCTVATALAAGCLASADWTTFNGKQAALSSNAGTTHQWVSSFTAPNTFVTSQPAISDLTASYTAPIVRSTNTLSCNTASASQAGCLASADYTTFNGKQAALSSNSCATNNWLNAFTAPNTFSCAQPASSNLSDYGSIPNAALANSAITIGGASVSLGGSTSSFPSPGTIGLSTPGAAYFSTLSATGAATLSGGGTITGAMFTNQQITSTLASGTAPLAVTSTTPVANLTIEPPVFLTATNCSSSASPAVCSAAPAGSITIAAGATAIVVDTTAVTANSQIFVMEDSSLGTKLGVTCNTTIARTYAATARTAATSFTITTSATPITNPACLSYLVVN